MATTTNFGWETPDDTDLVKDGAAAMRTLGNAIDTSFVDLKGGTTGQILSKASNTDLDYAWITNDVGDITAVTAGTGITGGGTSGAVTITNDMATKIDAKGDLIVGTGADTYDRLAVGGTNGHTLQVDSTAATGMKWAAVASGPTAWSLLNAGGTALTGATTITVNITAPKQLLILVDAASSANNSAKISIRVNGINTQDYSTYGSVNFFDTTYAAGNFDNTNIYSNSTAIDLGIAVASASDTSGYCFIDLADQTGWKRYQSVGAGSGSSGSYQWNVGGFIEMSAAITSVSIVSSSGNFDGGTVYVMGAN